MLHSLSQLEKHWKEPLFMLPPPPPPPFPKAGERNLRKQQFPPMTSIFVTSKTSHLASYHEIQSCLILKGTKYKKAEGGKTTELDHISRPRFHAPESPSYSPKGGSK